MTLVDLGFGNMLNAERVISIITADAAPTKRTVSAAKERSLAIDATCGKKTKSVIIMDSGHVILCAKETQKLAEALEKQKEREELK